MNEEEVLHQTSGLQRFEKPVPPVFIFGSYLGSLVLTNQRLLFLSSGGSGVERVIAGSLLGVLTPESLRHVTATLEERGSLAIPHSRLRACAGHRRWDFGRYLRVTYWDGSDREQSTSFIFRGPGLGSKWIQDWEQVVAPHLRR